MRNDKAQMMVLESVIFAISVVVALAFISQISPTSTSSGARSSVDLKIMGDNALDVIYSETMHIKDPGDSQDYTTNNPTSKLAVCIITNDYANLVGSLNSLLDANVIYNIYISNGSKTVFWCSSALDKDNPLPMIDPVAISHHPISIDPKHLSPQGKGGFSWERYPYRDPPSNIYKHFVSRADLEHPYTGSTYEVILEMSRILPS